jgi:hypothetical protein
MINPDEHGRDWALFGRVSVVISLLFGLSADAWYCTKSRCGVFGLIGVEGGGLEYEKR